jgi:hypothetical protein
MGGIIGFKDIIGSATITITEDGDVIQNVSSGSANNLKYRSLQRSVVIDTESLGGAGNVIVRCTVAGTIRVAALAGVSGFDGVKITSVSCSAFSGATLLEAVTLSDPAELLDTTRANQVLPFVFSADRTVTSIEFAFAVAPSGWGTITIGRAVAMRGIYLEHGFGRDWEIDHDDTTETAYVGRYGSPSVLRGATFRKITAPVPLASETLLFGDGLSTSYNQNLDDFVRYVGRGDDVLLVPRTSATAGDLFKQRASILGLLDAPLPNFKHRAGRLWNTSITVREAR